jgi:hypothetical protein
VVRRCDLETSRMRRPCPTGGLSRQKHTNNVIMSSHKKVIIFITIKISCSCATCCPVPVSHIQKTLQLSSLVPAALWSVGFYYPWPAVQRHSVDTSQTISCCPIFRQRLDCYIIPFQYLYVGRDSSVGIATRYGLDGPGIESLWGAIFSAPVQTDSEAHPTSYTMGTGSFLGLKRHGSGVGHPPPSSAEVTERIELYLYSPSGPSWTVRE